MSVKQISPANSLLAGLPHQDSKALLAGGDLVALSFGEVLCRPGVRLEHVYFPTEGFISLLTAEGNPASLEVGLIGNEGMLGASLILGVDAAPLRGLVQGKGVAWRLSAVRFRREVSRRPALRRLIARYLYVLMQQLGQMVACCRHHEVDARLARWLLMTQDRAHADRFHLTHQFLALMLGVRREGVTTAAARMRKRRVIGYSRGEIEVLSRSSLEAAACSCYRTDLANYRRILG